MISVSKALSILKREASDLGSERVGITSPLVGRVLTEDIIADSDLPPFDRSQMDGFAVIAKDTVNTPVDLKIVGESAAGCGWHRTLKRGQSVRIMTGAPVPKGADAVQKVELTSEGIGSSPQWENGTADNIRILQPTEKGRFIISKGFEIKKGTNVFAKGEVIAANMIASLAAFGYSRVKVARQPRIAIFSTGSEIVEIDKKPAKDQIRNSNSIMLKTLAENVAGAVEIFPMIDDDLHGLKTQISAAAASADILITTGGVSVGKYDLTKLALIELGAKIFFDKVALKPGKPTVFARLGKTFIFGLPGNPVSAAVTFHLFVRSLAMSMQSAAEVGLRRGFAVMRADTRGTKDRDTYSPATLAADKAGRLIATPLRWHGSSDFIGFARAEGLVIIPRGKNLAAGEVAKVLYL